MKNTSLVYKITGRLQNGNTLGQTTRERTCFVPSCIRQESNEGMNSCGSDLPSIPLIARFMGPSWGPSGPTGSQVGPMSAPLTLLSGTFMMLVLSCQESTILLNKAILNRNMLHQGSCNMKFHEFSLIFPDPFRNLLTIIPQKSVIIVSIFSNVT